ncbi:metallophosphoesterase [Acetomicrobium sp.]|uniref:metallophosphoesterase n=1 Tax=Acetomicrobium sp. TaxID=1872099 RepID=UPI002872A4E1|nr:metallophosphoesterase [Acetomicrobium sp.]MDR9769789.1 metallophosphoesterase [Acetomicrobium sp.]
MDLRLIILLGIVLLIYVLTNYYIYIHIAPLCLSPRGKILIPLLLLIMAAYPVGRILQAFISPGIIIKIIIAVGSYYLAFMAYAFFLVLFMDIYRLLSSFSFLPLLGTTLQAQIWKVGICLIIVLISFGSLNARKARIVTLSLEMPLGNPAIDSLCAVAVSDIHVGPFINSSRIRGLVDKINGLSPDIVFLVGDIVDESISAAAEEGLAEELKRIKAPLGIYAVPGNHEYYAGIEDVQKYLSRGGVRLLRDEFVVIKDSLILVGREDIMANRLGEEKRRPLSEILREAPKNLPIIVLDHTPINLEEATSQGVAIQLSGHTHNGQMWPFNLITRLIFEKSWGLLQKENTLIYVSCGYGTWGPPVRIGSTPEIILLNLTLNVLE